MDDQHQVGCGRAVHTAVQPVRAHLGGTRSGRSKAGRVSVSAGAETNTQQGCSSTLP